MQLQPRRRPPRRAAQTTLLRSIERRGAGRAATDFAGDSRPARLRRLHHSVHGLHQQAPELSAYRTLIAPQKAFLVTLAAATILAVAIWPLKAAIVLCGLGTALYIVVFLYRLVVFCQVLRRPDQITVTDEEAEAIPDSELPVYTVMVPAYHEPDVIAHTIAALEALRYPCDRLDVMLLLEDDDLDTIQAARAAQPAAHIRIIEVPSSPPRTKPKACNYGLTFARGTLLTIYDAEDRPDPLQLRRAVAGFRCLDDSVSCLQARLSYHNATQNILTRWFTAEYLAWFGGLLPALVRQGVPVPLGGTSMHIRRSVLERIGAWDPHNVTEDADLGVRMHRLGYRTLVLDSTTYEEANSDFVNWVKQRSRWYKGYMQTWLVHVRHPLRLLDELGLRGFLAFHLVVGGTPFIALVNPMFWLLAILWVVVKLPVVADLFPPLVYYPAMLCMVVGNFFVLYTHLVILRVSGEERLVWAVVLSPLYWLMMSIAALKAFLQLFTAPWSWEKTTHGLDLAMTQEVNVDAGE
jgi:cellulose synthase/poly-beta-1,6-N-acetylglucosamine synthase-like glycosyltransferase